MHTFSHLLSLGIDQSSDLDRLLALGIRQFFAGYMPQDWLNRFGSQISPNRRYRLREQFTDTACLAQTAEKLHCAGASLSLLLNAPFVTPTLQPYLKEQARFLAALPQTALIAGSPATALLLAELGVTGLTLSNLFGCYSTETVAWCLETFQPGKIILPRDLLPDEITAITQTFPDTAFEAFLCGDTCRFSEPYCFVEHGFDRVIPRDLCQYARQECRPHSRAPLRFRAIVRQHGADADAAKALTITPLDGETLLDNLCAAVVAGRADQIAAALDRLAAVDLAGWLQERAALYDRTVVVLQGLEHPVAERLRQRLAAALPERSRQGQYRAFHGLDPAALQSLVQLYRTLPNITTWKLPARGRNLDAILGALAAVFNGNEEDCRP